MQCRQAKGYQWNGILKFLCGEAEELIQLAFALPGSLATSVLWSNGYQLH